ncbi:MAG: glycosyltransferase [Synechococcaceae cyanobacterium SM2_3_60]|nr:glycosyltransferase [Synechococcaceae cyanobacterium SM2_3_60]
MNTVHIAVIIPTWQEATTIATCLDQLVVQIPPFSVVVVDGGSTDATIAIANSYSDRLPLRCVISPQRGRAAQMNWGAQHCDPAAEVLLFLHADSLLPTAGLAAIRDGIGGRLGGRFRVQLDDDRWPYRLISWGINSRSQITGAFTGDMGIYPPQLFSAARRISRVAPDWRISRSRSSYPMPAFYLRWSLPPVVAGSSTAPGELSPSCKSSV